MDTGHSKDISINTSRPTVGDALYDQLLTAILNGRFAPGERINDVALAREIGISRTPVREALQRLKTLGVVEAEPNRFTRVAIISPEQTQQHWIVMDSLLRGVVREIDGKASGKALKAAKTALKALKGNNPAKDARALAETAGAIADLSNNVPLRATLNASGHVVSLGGIQLFGALDAKEIADSLGKLIDALEAGSAKDADAALDSISAAIAQ
jgi:DNA-binding GntR family transcriptional regulator